MALLNKLPLVCRWKKTSEWQSILVVDLEWKAGVERTMNLYTKATYDSTIKFKESALIFHHQDADHDFGSLQAKELSDHLKHVIANEPAVVRKGKNIVEVKPQVCVSRLPLSVFPVHCTVIYLTSNLIYLRCKQRLCHRKGNRDNGWQWRDP